METIRQVDVAWLAVSTLHRLTGKALAAVEAQGGVQCEAATKAHDFSQASHGAIVEILSNLNAPKRLTFPSLIASYKKSESYTARPYKTRCSYQYLISRIEREFGDVAIATLTSNDLKSCYERWTGGGEHLSVALSIVRMIRILLRYGASALNDNDCLRLSTTLGFTHFKKSRVRKQRQITKEQAEAFRKQAHKMGLHVHALAQALMFETRLGQKRIIGEWLPLNEPGESTIVTANEKWIGGLDWSQLDVDWVLQTPDGEIDLEKLPMVAAELNRYSAIPENGPMIVGRSKRPYKAMTFRYIWRKIANAAGIPRDVANKRAGRARRTIDLKRIAWERATAATRSLPEDIRDDVRGEMVADMMAGKLRTDQTSMRRQEYVSAYWKKNRERYGAVPLDNRRAEMLPGA